MSEASAMRDRQSLAGTVQPCGALLILDADAGRLLQASANLEAIIGVPVETALGEGPVAVLGRELARRLRRELQGRQRLPGALSIKRKVAGRLRSLQLDARRSGERVLVEIEPLNRTGNRRLLATVNRWLSRFAEAGHPEELLEALAAGVADLTGHDRVLVCAFDGQGHGAVLAEQCAPGVPSMGGMRFPASDFPPHMRSLYDRVALRSVPDVRAAAVPLVPGQDPLTAAAPRLEGSLLRAISVEQQRYLEGMGVAALLSLAMQGDTGLWGLVLCHGMTPHPVSPAVRDAALSLVQMATQRLFLLRARSEVRFLQRVQDSRELLGSDLPAPDTLLAHHAEEWLALFQARGVALMMPSLESCAGQVPDTAGLRQLVGRLEASHRHPGPWSTEALGDEPLTADLDMGEACGLLAVPFPVGQARRGWMLLFRPEQREIHSWAGLPGSGQRAEAPEDVPLLGRLFSEWQEEIRGRSATWERIERLAAMDLAEDLAVMASAEEIQRLYASLRQEQQALAQANRRLERLAHHDPLTQVWNRYRIEQAMDVELSAAERYGRPLALLLFDIDHFKQVNDTHGHELGDRVLSTLSRQVEEALRDTDFLGRWGGEEFIVLATSSDLEAGLGLAERLRRRIAAMEVPGLPVQVTASIGVAAWRPGDTRKSLLARADAAMYRGKQEGRNRVEAEG
ncbi:diguanylate cyclase (GGDEF)-like protein [Halomonas campaniensis]|uniref:diguanylate cyclase n=1 Tax=Halomonas campaniensis TaxID=213554 RepID=A0A7W5K5Z5_9GAMM|nr:sensor domain-containing diguanylate cyclase [Halomonas campaniensis]MBB3332532.1 diguanylate cyclase (GGDEF)-like protein [Halomonas campaniensis]